MKHLKSWKNVRRVLAGFLAVAMIMTSMPISSVSAEETNAENVTVVEASTEVSTELSTEELVTEVVVTEATESETTEVTEVTTENTEEILVEAMTVEEPVSVTLPTSEAGKIDVWDFGAEQLDSSTYNNLLNEDVINSWYSGVEAGTKGVNIASFECGDLSFNDGGYPTTHRLRTTNTAISRYDEKSKSANGVTYSGFIYSNKSASSAVYVGLNLQIGDKVSYVVSSNGTEAHYTLEAPSGATQTAVYDAADAATTITFYATEAGVHKLYTTLEKLVVCRIYREHTNDVVVSGTVTAPSGLTDYSVVFTNTLTGVATEAVVADGAYSATLKDGYDYEVTLANANGYVITSETALSLGKNAGATTFDVAVGSVELVKVSGSISGLDEATLANLNIALKADQIYVPVVAIDGNTWSAELESNIEYVVGFSGKGTADYNLADPTTMKVSEASTMDITFEAKPVYTVTIEPSVATLADLAEATFTFTRHSDADVTVEEDYVYTFTGTDNIKLRDGVYTVKVTNSGDYKQKLTSNVKVDGADVTKKINFEFTGDPTQPKTWSFTSEEYTGQTDYNGLTITGGKRHGAQYGMSIKNGSIEVPVTGPCTIAVGVGYTWEVSFADETEVHLQTTNGGTTTLEYKYTGEAGTVKINVGGQTTTYISSITMTPVVEGATLPTSWSFTDGEYTGQTPFNGLTIVGGKYHGTTYGMYLKNGTIEVPVAGPCTIEVGVGYTWDVTFADEETSYVQTTDGGHQTLTYAYTGEAGEVVITAGSQATTYIKSIDVIVESADEAEDKVLTVGATDCDYSTINEALAAVKKMNREAGQRVIIEIQPGDYEEMLVIDVDNVTLKNASATPSIETKNKGVDIDDNAVRITSYYGHGYTYYSMGSDCKYSEEILEVNKENGYPSFENPGSGTTNGSYWNATVVINADGFEAEGIIFENSFNQYVSKKAANDVIVAQTSAKEGSVPRADMKAGDTTVQNKKYVERAAALAIYNNVQEASFDNCKFIGRQDTLYGGTGVTAAFYDCAIYGGTDYIFGGMTAVFAKCDLVFNTSEDGNDVGYITAAQTKSGRGMLMYNCTVTSTTPGVDTASEYPSKAGYLGRPWAAGTGEAVFYNTVIEATDSHWYESCASLIQPAGWLSTLSGESALSAEYGTYEMAKDVDNQSSRVSWATTLTEPVLADGTTISVEAFLGDWDAFAGKDMEIVMPTEKVDNKPVEEETPSATTEFVFESKDLTPVAQGTKADGDTEKAGTEDYFTLIYSVKSKVDSSKKTFDDSYASEQRVNFGGKATTEKNALKFTTNNAATVKVWWVEGGDDNRQMTILDASGTAVVTTNETLAKNATCISTLELAEAGTYYLGGATNNNYIFKVVVTEEVAAEPIVSTLDTTADLTAFAQGAKADGDSEKAGTDGYFTLIYSAKTKVDGSKKTFDDGYAATQRVNFGGTASTEKNAIKFTTSNASSVKVWWAEGGDNNRQITILDAAGTTVATTNETLAKNATCISTLELAEAGTYYLGSAVGNNYIFKVEVTEMPGGAAKPDRADWSTVAAPAITNIAVNAEDANKVDVTVNANIGYDGADKITVSMLDAAETVVGTANSMKEGNGEVTVTLTPSASGTYTFSVKAIRDGEEDKVCAETKAFDFVLPLVAPTIKGAYNVGNGVLEVEWDAVKEAEKYVVSVNGTDISVETTELIAKLEGLTVGETYTIEVKAVRGEDAVASTIEKLVENNAEVKWYFAAYGSSTNTSNNGYEVLEDGSVRVYSTGGKGKIVPGSTDGLAYYYTEIDPDTTNFTLSATAKVNTWTLSNGQEGFGIMASDRAGKHGDSTAFWNNAYMAIASKVEYYYDSETGEATDDSTKQKVTMKLGIGSQEKVGVTAENLAEFDANNTAVINEQFKSTCTTLELSGGKTGANNVVGNGTNVEGGVTEFKFKIQKNNTGYFVSYTDAEGNTTTKKYYDTEALSQIEEDKVCLGFFASRNADVTFTDIEFTTIAPEDDAPAEERPVTLVTPNFAITSATVANGAAYDLVYVGNADGTLVIKNAEGKTLLNRTDVKADEKVTLPVTLSVGNNTFNVKFTPNADYVPGEYQKLSSYATSEFKHVVNYQIYGEAGDSLYVSPNGKSTGTGTKSNPLDVYTAIKYVQAGQSIIIMEGTYNLTSTVKVERGINGTKDAMIYMIADPEATTRPVFDFGGRCAGMVLAGDYWYFKGFDVTNSADGQKGMQISGDYNVVDQVNAYKNGNTGIQISRYLGTDTYEDWPAYNLILNCTSYLNADKGYEDADGFAAKLTVGDGNVFDGCVAHHNADDGWDLFAKVQSGSIGVVTIQNSVAYKNGYVFDENGNEINAGNGNGFKMGGDSMPGAHILKNSVAFENKAKGIDSNSGPDIKVFNCISFNNQSYNVALYTNTAANTDYEVNGVVSLKTKYTDVAEQFKLKGTQDNAKVYGVNNYYWDGANSANSEGAKADTSWFVSTEFTGVSRNADGSITMGDFLVPTEACKVAGVGLGGTASGDVTVGPETSGEVVNGKVDATQDAVEDVVEDIVEATTPEEVVEAVQNFISSIRDIWSSVTIRDEETPLADAVEEQVEVKEEVAEVVEEVVEVEEEKVPLAAEEGSSVIPVIATVGGVGVAAVAGVAIVSTVASASGAAAGAAGVAGAASAAGAAGTTGSAATAPFKKALSALKKLFLRK